MTVIQRPYAQLVAHQAALMVACLIVSACADRGAEDLSEDSFADVQFNPSLDIDLPRMSRSPTGLYFEDLEQGSGELAEAGRDVVVHYTGWLPSGQEFDSSHDRGEPYVFLLGTGDVIQGWHEGVAGMKVGGRRKLVIPPELAYGEAGRPGAIPPNATLVFDVELLDVR